MVHQVKNLTSDQRVALENLLGRGLRDDESVVIRPAVVVKEAPTGDERVVMANNYRKHLDMLAERVKDVPEDEIDAAIAEAVARGPQNSQ